MQSAARRIPAPSEIMNLTNDRPQLTSGALAHTAAHPAYPRAEVYQRTQPRAHKPAVTGMKSSPLWRALLYRVVKGVGLQLIQQAEVKDDRRVIEVLAQPGTSVAQAAGQPDRRLHQLAKETTLHTLGLCAGLFYRRGKCEEVINLGHLQ